MKIKGSPYHIVTVDAGDQTVKILLLLKKRTAGGVTRSASRIRLEALGPS